MRTRSRSKRPHPVDEKEAAENKRTDNLPSISGDDVGKNLKRVKKGFKKEDDFNLRQCEAVVARESVSEDIEKKPTGTCVKDTAHLDSHGREAMDCVSDPETDDEGYGFDDTEWEDGSVHAFSSRKDFQDDIVNGVSVEFDVSPVLAKGKHVRRATAEEKELAELVHKAHLLCLLGRGRLIDSACNDPLIQASLLSLVPNHLLKETDTTKLTASCLSPIVSWLHNSFRVRSPSLDEKSYNLVLASTLESQEGTPEAVAALSVALFRAMNLTTRFVSILDVTSLKPGVDKSEHTFEHGSKREKNIFNSATPMVAGPSATKSSPDFEQDCSQNTAQGSGRKKAGKSRKDGLQSQDGLTTDKPKDNMTDEATTNASEPHLIKSERSKRKGDLEFQMQLEMALAATAVGSSNTTVAESPSTCASLSPHSKRMRKIIKDEPQTSSNGISTAIGSKKVGAPLYWAEVFCGGENLTGKWVHVDAVNATVDGEHNVEAAAAACRRSLRYVVAFAGNGAKDVTRRYCTKWYKVATQRISSAWWDAVLAPLKELESAATAGTSDLEFEQKIKASSQVANLDHGCLPNASEIRDVKVVRSPMRNGFSSTRSSLEDMELETRALTEPLPTNQQAYRNHHLYVIERWLKKYEILHPKGPVLGFISGHAVYPRACVQTLHTKQRWLHEGLQVKAGEVPVKILNRSQKSVKESALDDGNNYADGDHVENTTALYGKWQMEPLNLPQAVDGIVPKNERGRVDVWSEKCLPPGTVHLRLPRVAHVAKRLDIDFAPAMVGFEFRNGRSVPLFEGIVVCSEFKHAILAAYAEEEERREAEEKRKNEAQALSRWYQLLSSMVMRQRLNSLYGKDGASSQSSDKHSNSATTTHKKEELTQRQPEKSREKHPPVPRQNHEHEHEHEYVLEDSGDGSTQIKRCRCGFSIQFEEL